MKRIWIYAAMFTLLVSNALAFELEIEKEYSGSR